MDLSINQIICGNALKVLKRFPAESINCCISSPPYWALRDYGWDTCTLWGSLDDFCMPKSKKKRDRWWIMIRWRASLKGGIFSPNKKAWIGALGLEPTIELYLEHLLAVYDQVKRVLRKDGTCWVNLGDSYAGSGGEHKPWHKSDSGFQHKSGFSKYALENEFSKAKTDLPTKSLCLIPYRFAIAMIKRGWILRNIINWVKPNPMPSSAKDRFTVDFEPVFFFVKNKSYFFEPQYEPVLETTLQRDKYTRILAQDGPQAIRHNHETPSNPLGRNKRTTWTIPTQAEPAAHFATFPDKLVEPMIKAGCPRYVCSKCETPRKKMYELTEEYKKLLGDGGWRKGAGADLVEGMSKTPNKKASCYIEQTFKGYSKCSCNADFEPGIVLDPFVVRARPVRSLPKMDGIISGLTLRLSMSMILPYLMLKWSRPVCQWPSKKQDKRDCLNKKNGEPLMTRRFSRRKMRKKPYFNFSFISSIPLEIYFCSTLISRISDFTSISVLSH